MFNNNFNNFYIVLSNLLLIEYITFKVINIEFIIIGSFIRVDKFFYKLFIILFFT